MSVASAVPDASYLLGVDIGGTFTDIVAVGADGSVYRGKVPSAGGASTGEAVDAIQGFLLENDINPQDVVSVIHGTTVATNAILEGKGAVTGLLTTKGFRDVLEIGRLSRPTLFEMNWNKPKPLVPRRLRLEIDERTSYGGSILTPVEKNQVLRQIDYLKQQDVQSLAIAFLHSYANPSHEEEVRALIADAWPDVQISLSSEVLPEIREYERTSTTVVNAYVRPIVERYIAALEQGFRSLSIQAPLVVMQSNGGVAGSKAARTTPVTIIESGPAAGVLATSYLAKATNLVDGIAFDMGGTTAKASVIEASQPKISHEYEVGGGQSGGATLARGGGYPIRVPSIDVTEVGNGGGSIARIDAGGVLRVGPDSAGADPGPACYGRGNRAPTVTDANVALGYLNPNHLAGGRLQIDPQLAWKAIKEYIAGPLELDIHEAAHGIHILANANMAQALRAVTTERGRDPGDFTLIAFGGSGPMHAATLAQSMGVRRVLVPVFAGLFSTMGLLFADVKHDFAQTILMKWDSVTADALQGHFDKLTKRAQQQIDELAGLSLDACTSERLIDMRLAGQSHELSVRVDTALNTASLERIRRSFENEYLRVYGHPANGALELVNIRLEVTYASYDLSYRDLTEHATKQTPAPHVESATRTAYFGSTAGFIDVSVLTHRDELNDTPVDGPFVIEEHDSTTLIPPGCTACRDEYNNIIIDVPPSGGAGRGGN